MSTLLVVSAKPQINIDITTTEAHSVHHRKSEERIGSPTSNCEDEH